MHKHIIQQHGFEVVNDIKVPLTSFELAKQVVSKLRRIKKGDSFTMNYVLWSKVSFRVKFAIAMFNISITAYRDKQNNIKDVRIWRTN